MSYKEEFASNNTDLQSILDMVNALPDAGGGVEYEVLITVTLTDSGGQESRFLSELGTLTVGGVAITSVSQDISVPKGSVKVSYTLTKDISNARTVAVNGTTIGTVKTAGTNVSTTVEVTGDTIIAVTMKT